MTIRHRFGIIRRRRLTPIDTIQPKHHIPPQSSIIQTHPHPLTGCSGETVQIHCSLQCTPLGGAGRPPIAAPIDSSFGGAGCCASCCCCCCCCCWAARAQGLILVSPAGGRRRRSRDVSCPGVMVGRQE